MAMNAEDPLFQRERSQAKEDGPSQNGQSSAISIFPKKCNKKQRLECTITSTTLVN